MTELESTRAVYLQMDHLEFLNHVNSSIKDILKVIIFKFYTLVLV